MSNIICFGGSPDLQCHQLFSIGLTSPPVEFIWRKNGSDKATLSRFILQNDIYYHSFNYCIVYSHKYRCTYTFMTFKHPSLQYNIHGIEIRTKLIRNLNPLISNNTWLLRLTRIISEWRRKVWNEDTSTYSTFHSDRTAFVRICFVSLPVQSWNCNSAWFYLNVRNCLFYQAPCWRRIRTCRTLSVIFHKCK